jgi:hypothetical protein
MKYEDEEGEKVRKNLGGWWNTTLHCSKRINEAWICQKCKKQSKFCHHPFILFSTLKP